MPLLDKASRHAPTWPAGDATGRFYAQVQGMNGRRHLLRDRCVAGYLDSAGE